MFRSHPPIRTFKFGISVSKYLRNHAYLKKKFPVQKKTKANPLRFNLTILESSSDLDKNMGFDVFFDAESEFVVRFPVSTVVFKLFPKNPLFYTKTRVSCLFRAFPEIGTLKIGISASKYI
jgi:hypothetical protein